MKEKTFIHYWLNPFKDFGMLFIEGKPLQIFKIYNMLLLFEIALNITLFAFTYYIAGITSIIIFFITYTMGRKKSYNKLMASPKTIA